MPAEITWATSATEVGRPVPRLMACPTAVVGLEREQDARATMSRDVGEVARLLAVLEDRPAARPLSSREAKIAATPVYGFESAWPGP